MYFAVSLFNSEGAVLGVTKIYLRFYYFLGSSRSKFVSYVLFTLLEAVMIIEYSFHTLYDMCVVCIRNFSYIKTR